MRIGVLTGGGDAPGINACIKTIVTRSEESGFDVLGIMRGWSGLLNTDPADAQRRFSQCVKLTRETVRKIDRTGGTFLHSSRINPGNLSKKDIPVFLRGFSGFRPGMFNSAHFDSSPHIERVIETLGIDALIVIGGDDTIAYAEHLSRQGLRIIAIPKTMDNDVFGTDYCIGFGTAVTRSVQFIHQLRTSAGSHERITIVELFGSNTGETCLISAYLASIDRALIPEVSFDPEKLADMLIADKAANASNYAMVAISEGARMEGNKFIEYCRGSADENGGYAGGIGQLTKETLSMLTGEAIICQPLGYLMRSGIPDALDLMVSCNFGQLAVDLVNAGNFGVMVALRNGLYSSFPLEEVTKHHKRVDVTELYDSQAYRPKMRHVLGKPMFLY